jgi:hypothetical protein
LSKRRVERPALYRPDLVVNRVFASQVNWLWNGTPFAAP